MVDRSGASYPNTDVPNASVIAEDEGERNQGMGEILKYNEEDLAATWTVFEWLRRKTTAAQIPFLAASASDQTPSSGI